MENDGSSDRGIEIYEWQNKVVRHFKGDLYLILGIAQHTETGEKMVVYRALYGNCELFTRPLNMFIEQCSQEQFEKYGQKYRFEKIEIDSVKK